MSDVLQCQPRWQFLVAVGDCTTYENLRMRIWGYAMPAVCSLLRTDVDASFTIPQASCGFIWARNEITSAYLAWASGCHRLLATAALDVRRFSRCLLISLPVPAGNSNKLDVWPWETLSAPSCTTGLWVGENLFERPGTSAK